MRYSYEFKLMCVELYHSGSYPDIPEGLNPDTRKAGSINMPILEISYSNMGLYNPCHEIKMDKSLSKKIGDFRVLEL